MEFFAELADQVATLRGLLGAVEDPARLPVVMDELQNEQVVQALEVASSITQLVNRVHVSASGVIARRSTREHGHSGLAQTNGHRGALSLVQHVTGTSRREAARHLRIGESLFETGTPPNDAHGPNEPDGPDADFPSARDEEPWHAPLRSALMNGQLTPAQHDAIRRGLGKPPSSNDLRPVPISAEVAAEYAAAWSAAAEHLIAEAPRCSVEGLAATARTVRDQLDPAGAELRYHRRYDERSFKIWIDRTGVHHGHFVFDDESAALVWSVIDAALRPRKGGPRFVDPGEQAQADQLRDDPRTNEQLTFDLMIDLLHAGALADAATVFGARQAGVRLVRIVNTADKATVTDLAYTEDGLHVLPAWVARQRACTAGVTPITIDRAGTPLDVGRTQRLFTAQQRIAMGVRDGGCRWTGCDRPASYCESHHIDEWKADRGRTDIDRGISLCRYHHLHLHNNGWNITREGTGDFVLHRPDGRTELLPPKLQLRYFWAGVGPPRQRFASSQNAPNSGRSRPLATAGFRDP